MPKIIVIHNVYGNLKKKVRLESFGRVKNAMI